MITRSNQGSATGGTIIGPKVKLVGTLRDDNNITINGQVEGEVHSSQSIMVGETAEIKGPINGDIVIVAGTVHGSIIADTRLEILATGKVYGSLETKDLMIQSGAIFSGKSTMEGDTIIEQPIDQAPPVKPDKPEYEVE